MPIGYTNSSKEFSNIIYERRGSAAMCPDFVRKYLEAYPDAHLDYGDRIIVEKTDGVKVIYFRDDFADEESYCRLYEYILNGADSRDGYLRSKARYLRENDPEEFRKFFDSLNEGEQETVLSYDRKEPVFDEEDFLYRTLVMKEAYGDIVREWIVESEYRDDPGVLEEDRQRLNYVNCAYNDLYTICFNQGETVFSLAETVRDIIRILSGDGAEQSGGKNAVLSRKDALADYPFLFDEDPERFFEELSRDVPFTEELKAKLSEKRETFQECLYRLMDKKGIKSLSELTAKKNKIGVSSAVMSKWINNRDPNRTPDKSTVYAIIISAKLDMKDAADLLRSAKLEFGTTQEDIIVKTFIHNQLYDLRILDETVFEITHRRLVNKKY